MNESPNGWRDPTPTEEELRRMRAERPERNGRGEPDYDVQMPDGRRLRMNSDGYLEEV